MIKRATDFVLLATPSVILIADIWGKEQSTTMGIILSYLIVIFYGIIVFNVQFLQARESREPIKPIWLIPIMISVQQYLSLIIGYELSNFIVLAILIIAFARSIGIQDLSNNGLHIYISYTIVAIFASIYLRLPHIPFIILGPIWEQLFTQSTCTQESLEYIPLASLNASIIYNYDYILVAYAFFASTLRQLFKHRIGYILLFDSIARLILLWVLAYAV